MVELIAPDTVVLGQPFTVGFRATERVAGRIRLTAGTDAVPFVLEREGWYAVAATAHRVRGRAGDFVVRDWGDHPPGSELLLRFEGEKKWMTVTAP